MPNLVRADFIVEASASFPSDSKVAGALGALPGAFHLEIIRTSSATSHYLRFLATAYSTADGGIVADGALVTAHSGSGLYAIGALILRRSGVSTLYKAEFGGDRVTGAKNTVRIIKSISGTETVLASGTSANFDAAVAVQFMAVGTDLQFDVDSGGGFSTVLTASDAAIASGRPGFSMETTIPVGVSAETPEKVKFDNVHIIAAT